MAKSMIFLELAKSIMLHSAGPLGTSPPTPYSDHRHFSISVSRSVSEALWPSLAHFLLAPKQEIKSIQAGNVSAITQQWSNSSTPLG